MDRNLFMNMIEDSSEPLFEAPGDENSTENTDTGPPPSQDMPDPQMDTGSDPSAPPDMGDMTDPSMSGEDGFNDAEGDMGDGTGQNGQQQEEVPLDEKGEIFAKIDILKNYNHLYRKIQDTIDTIDKVDLVQIGNKINTNDVTEIKERLSSLMEDVYVTIVYEFQMSYSNLKVKLVEYSSRFILMVNQLTRLIKKDQTWKEE